MGKLGGMRLYGMAGALQAALETGSATEAAQELVARLVEAEWEDKHQRRTERLVRMARFRTGAYLSDMDWATDRNLDRNLIAKLADGRFVKENRSVLITGPTGVGKSFVAQALGSQACELGYSTVYWNCTKLFPVLREKHRDGSNGRFMKGLAKASLLILDDFGLARMETQERMGFLEIVEDRHGRGGTIVTSQLPVAAWHEIIGDKTIADAVCDRLIHRSIRIELKGTSLRAREPGSQEKKDLVQQD
jgi:DNA replication protein DnaC